MKLRYSMKFLLAAMTFLAIGIVIWRVSLSHTSIEETNTFIWNDGAFGIVRKVHTGAWEHHDSTLGDGIYIQLEHVVRDTDTVDGAGAYEIFFQLPSTVSVGDVIELRPAVSDRPEFVVSKMDTLSFLSAGEFVAFRFSNPMMDWAMDANPESTATVKIESWTDSSVTIHLKLLAILEDVGDLELDRKFTLIREPTIQ